MPPIFYKSFTSSGSRTIWTVYNTRITCNEQNDKEKTKRKRFPLSWLQIQKLQMFSKYTLNRMESILLLPICSTASEMNWSITPFNVLTFSRKTTTKLGGYNSRWVIISHLPCRSYCIRYSYKKSKILFHLLDAI